MIGARIDCSTDQCLDDYAWKCFVYEKKPTPPNSCIVQLGDVVGMDDLSLPRMSWGSEVEIVVGGTTINWECGGTPSARLEPGYKESLVGTIGREFALRPLPQSGGFSVQACYCPSYDGADAGFNACDSSSDFVQKVGRIYYYSMSVCDDAACTNKYPTLVAGAPVTLRVQCANSIACKALSVNRIKVIDSSPLGVNDRPSWAINAGCRIAEQSAAYWRPYNCAPSKAAQCGGCR